MPQRKRRRLNDNKAKPESQNTEAPRKIANSPKRTVSVLSGDVSGTDSSTQASVTSLDPALLDEEEVPYPPLSPAHQQAFFSGGGEGSYNAIKMFNGQYYSGMAIGGSHTWDYDSGVWKETKMEPDLWQINYETHKRRAKNAPRGSGAPVGTEYHWYIIAHQYVKKIDANTYTTHLTGRKYKLAHKNASSESWSIPTVKGQRDREVELLEDAKRRVEGLPPVLGSQKVKVAQQAKGQKTLDSMFSEAAKKERPKECAVGRDILAKESNI